MYTPFYTIIHDYIRKKYFFKSTIYMTTELLFRPYMTTELLFRPYMTTELLFRPYLTTDLLFRPYLTTDLLFKAIYDYRAVI